MEMGMSQTRKIFSKSHYYRIHLTNLPGFLDPVKQCHFQVQNGPAVIELEMRKIKMKKYFLWVPFLTVFFFILSQTVSAQQTKELTLLEAIKLSLANSHKLEASSARVQQALSVLQQAKEKRLPDASATGSFVWLNNPDLTLKTEKTGSGNDSTGGLPTIHKATYGLVNVSLPIFTAGKIKYGIESAKYLEQAALLQSSDDTSAIIYNTIEAYTNLYKASATIRVVRENLEHSLHRDSTFLRLENNGLLARNDRLKAQLQSSNIEVSLLEAQSNTQLAMVNMNLMLGLPENTELVLDSSAFELPANPESLMDLEQYSLANRKDMLALEQRANAARSGISLARAFWYPDISLTGGYIAAYIPHVLTLSNAINVGIGLHYNISSLWKTKSKITEASAKLKEVEANKLQLQDGIKMQIHRSFENYILGENKLGVYQKAIIQAAENYRITKNKFDNDLVNTRELLDANLLLLQSKINLTVARADLYLAYTKLLQTAGKLSQ